MALLPATLQGDSALKGLVLLSAQKISGAGMKTNHLGIAALLALVCVLTWTVIGKPSSVQRQASGPVVTTGIRWDRQPADCEGDCLKGYRWGIRHEVTERKDCRSVPHEALGGCLRVVEEVERFKAEDVAALTER